MQYIVEFEGYKRTYTRLLSKMNFVSLLMKIKAIKFGEIWTMNSQGKPIVY